MKTSNAVVAAGILIPVNAATREITPVERNQSTNLSLAQNVLTGEDWQRLLLKPLEAAKCLGISERQLWQRSAPRGSIPVTRIGNSVRYSLTALKEWIATSQNGGEQ